MMNSRGNWIGFEVEASIRFQFQEAEKKFKVTCGKNIKPTSCQKKILIEYPSGIFATLPLFVEKLQATCM